MAYIQVRLTACDVYLIFDLYFDYIPKECTCGGPLLVADIISLCSKRHDMANRHEEADVIVVNQVMSAARQGSKNIHAVCDDTDVFVL